MILYLDKIDVGNVETTISEKSISSTVDQVTSKTFECKKSIFARAAEKFYFVLKWLISWLCIWNYFRNVKFQSDNGFQCLCKLYTCRFSRYLGIYVKRNI